MAGARTLEIRHAHRSRRRRHLVDHRSDRRDPAELPQQFQQQLRQGQQHHRHGRGRPTQLRRNQPEDPVQCAATVEVADARARAGHGGRRTGTGRPCCARGDVLDDRYRLDGSIVTGAMGEAPPQTTPPGAEAAAGLRAIEGEPLRAGHNRPPGTDGCWPVHVAAAPTGWSPSAAWPLIVLWPPLVSAVPLSWLRPMEHQSSAQAWMSPSTIHSYERAVKWRASPTPS